MPITARANTASAIVVNTPRFTRRRSTGISAPPAAVPIPSAASRPPYPIGPVWIFSLASSGSRPSSPPHGVISSAHRIIGPERSRDRRTSRQALPSDRLTARVGAAVRRPGTVRSVAIIASWDAAPVKSTTAAPKCPIRKPPSTGPAARPKSVLSALNEIASTRAFFGTSSLTNGFHAVCWTTTPIPTRNVMNSRSAGVKSHPPASAVTPIRLSTASNQNCETSSRVRWPTASVATPAGMAKMMNGRLIIVCTRLIISGLLVSEVIFQEMPSSNITRPRLKNRLALKKSRNRRCANSPYPAAVIGAAGRATRLPSRARRSVARPPARATCPRGRCGRRPIRPPTAPREPPASSDR